MTFCHSIFSFAFYFIRQNDFLYLHSNESRGKSFLINGSINITFCSFHFHLFIVRWLLILFLNNLGIKKKRMTLSYGEEFVVNHICAYFFLLVVLLVDSKESFSYYVTKNIHLFRSPSLYRLSTKN